LKHKTQPTKNQRVQINQMSQKNQEVVDYCRSINISLT